MINTTAQEEIARAEFAKVAAVQFAKDAGMHTWSDSDLVPGCLLAMRWGLGGDGVLVMRIDENTPIVNYQKLVKDEQKEAKNPDIPESATHFLFSYGDTYNYYKIDGDTAFHWELGAWKKCRWNVREWSFKLTPINKGE